MDTGHRGHGSAAEDLDVGMAAADQDELMAALGRGRRSHGTNLRRAEAA
jgi:hypothetical protein